MAVSAKIAVLFVLLDLVATVVLIVVLVRRRRGR
jgi:hypothetical protein